MTVLSVLFIVAVSSADDVSLEAVGDDADEENDKEQTY